MIRSSLFLTLAIVAILAVFLLGELSNLAPLRTQIFRLYAPAITAFAGLFALNLFGGIFAVNRKLFLRDTGQKLAHVEKQLRTGSSISEELTDRLTE